MMAALRACEIKPSCAWILERNTSLGRKLGLTGKGRCNLTNDASIEDFCGRFGRNGVFLRNVFSRFFASDLIAFFEARGLSMKTERQGRVFPSTDSSASVLSVLETALKTLSVEVRKGQRVKQIKRQEGSWLVFLEDGQTLKAEKVIVATGGASYPQTGSTGDGLMFARELGHSVVPLSAGLVPLESGERFIRQLQGLTLKNIRVTFSSGSRSLETPVGELLFTHFGVSGPLVLDHSGLINEWLKKAQVRLRVDLKPGLSEEQLGKKLQMELPAAASAKVCNYFKELLPQRLIDVVLEQADVDGQKKCHQVTQQERKRLVVRLKSFEFCVHKARPLEEAMVTCGGVSLKEINPKTMESRLAPGIYFCGEVLDLAASSGGFNLQAAFSTGYAAGEAAALSL